jgi:hypothetical protein
MGKKLKIIGFILLLISIALLLLLSTFVTSSPTHPGDTDYYKVKLDWQYRSLKKVLPVLVAASTLLGAGVSCLVIGYIFSRKEAKHNKSIGRGKNHH